MIAEVVVVPSAQKILRQIDPVHRILSVDIVHGISLCGISYILRLYCCNLVW